MIRSHRALQTWEHHDECPIANVSGARCDVITGSQVRRAAASPKTMIRIIGPYDQKSTRLDVATLPGSHLSVRCTYAMLKSGRNVEIMPIRSGMRNDRIELRASLEQKRLLTAAAAYEKLDLTTFVMRTTLPAAEEIVARNERIALTERDTARILELLEHPPTPPAALRAAAKRRRKRT